MLHHREIRTVDTNGSRFVKKLEQQRNLSLASPGGFLFSLNKETRFYAYSRDSNVKMTLQGKRIFAEREREISRSYFSKDALSVLQRSILQRRSLPFSSERKLKDLRITGTKTVLPKARENLRNERLDLLSLDVETRKNKLDFSLPPLRKGKLPNDFLTGRKEDSAFVCSRILPWKQDNLNKNKLEIKSSRAEKGVFTEKDKENSKRFKIGREIEDPFIISEKNPQKKRTINVFLPAISTEDANNDDS